MKQRVLIVLAGILTAFTVNGCATVTQGYMRQGPAMFGGTRLNIAIFASDETTVGSKVMSGIDFLFSFVFDFPFLLVSIPNELYEIIWENGITVRPPVHWDNPPPKHASYSAPPEEPVPGGRDSRKPEASGIGIN